MLRRQKLYSAHNKGESSRSVDLFCKEKFKVYLRLVSIPLLCLRYIMHPRSIYFSSRQHICKRQLRRSGFSLFDLHLFLTSNFCESNSSDKRVSRYSTSPFFNCQIFYIHSAFCFQLVCSKEISAVYSSLNIV